VVLAEKPSASRSVIEAFRGLYANFLVQEFVREAKGADIRCFVVGGKVVGRDEAPGQAGRVPLEPASRRHGRGGAAQRDRERGAVRAAA
jgi:ribosomal protein S6--L-glutamate ligase